MAKFRYYIAAGDYDGDCSITGTNDKKVADAAGKSEGTKVIDTESGMEISNNNPVEIAEEDGYQLT